jgi:O-antigen ligase
VVVWPFAGAVAFLVLAASALSPTWITYALGPLELRPSEVVLGGLLIAAAAAPRDRTWGGAAGGGILAFLAVVAVSALLAVDEGRTSVSDAYAWARGFAPLLLFFVVVRLFGDRRTLERLLTVAAAIAAATGLVSLAIAMGFDMGWLLADSENNFISDDGVAGTERVRLPGIALAYALLWHAVIQLASTRGSSRFGWALVVAGIALNLLLSFNRNMWVGAILGLVALLLLGGGGVRRPFAFGVMAVATTVAAIALLGVEVNSGSALEPIVERGQTLLDPETASRERSLQDRLGETDRAWDAFVEQPITGVGPGAPFGVLVEQQNRLIPQLYLHNQYLYLLVMGGVFALLAFLVFLLGALSRAHRRLHDPLVLACAVGIGMIMLSAFVMISFADANMATALALVTAAVVAGSRAAGPAEPEPLSG